MGREVVWLGSVGKKLNMYYVSADALHIVKAWNLPKLYTKI